MMDNEMLCLDCLAGKIAGEVLDRFTDAEPDVAMPYGAWMVLGAIIEDRVKAAFSTDATEAPSPVVVQ